ncbi:MAG: carbohydrate kinase [Cyclobacteriaceae bacterium]
MYLIGYDIGSSTIKASLIETSSNQHVCTVQYPDRDMDMISRQSGWAEQQPEIWWQDFCFATRKLLAEAKIQAEDIQAIGISYQMHGLVLIDKQKQALRPAIIWCDSRAVAIGDKAFNEIGPRWCLENCLNSPGNFTASRLKWVKDNEPHIYEQADKFLLPGDYIAMRVTGKVSTTLSGLSEAILWDFKEKKLANEVLDHLDLDKDLIPEIVSAFDVQGEVTEEASIMTGLKPGTPLTFRAGDQPSNALSLNVLRPGEIAATCGASGVVYGIVDRPLFDPKSRINAFSHVNYEENNDRIGVLACINGAGMQYGWMRHQIAAGGRSYDDMERMASGVPIGSEGLCILPFGNGAERILENKNLKSQIHNLQFNRHSRAHLFRAALEGVAFSFVYGINLLKNLGLNMEVLRVANDNMFQSEIFSQTMATLLDCKIEMFDTTAAVGAAKAAGVGIGVYQNVEEALGSQKPYVIFEPSLDKAQCEHAYQFWVRNLEKSLQEVAPTQHTDGNSSRLGDTVSLGLQLAAKNDLLNELKKDLLKLSEGKKSTKAIEKIAERIDQHLNKDRYWEMIEEHVDFIEGDFFKRLKAEHADLSAQDIRLSFLLRLKLSTKEIAEQLNLSIRGIETKRYRLRKKLGLDSHQLEEYLTNF